MITTQCHSFTYVVVQVCMLLFHTVGRLWDIGCPFLKKVEKCIDQAGQKATVKMKQTNTLRTWPERKWQGQQECGTDATK